MSGSGQAGFGGLCFNGHDVPAGATFCPTCGAPASSATSETFGGAQSQAAAAPQPGSYQAPPPYQPPPYQPPPPPAYQARPTAAHGYAPPPVPPGMHYPTPGYGYPPAYAPPIAGTNGLAIASMVLGILWLYWVGSVLAVIFGHVSLHQIKQRGQGGKGMAIAGLVLGYLGVATLIIVIIVAAANSGNSSGG